MRRQSAAEERKAEDAVEAFEVRLAAKLRSPAALSQSKPWTPWDDVAPPPPPREAAPRPSKQPRPDTGRSKSLLSLIHI